MTNDNRTDYDLSCAHERLAAALNYLAICVRHAGRDYYTDRDAQILKILAKTGDNLVTGEIRGAVPAGFGPVAKTHQSEALNAVHDALVKAGDDARAEALNEKEEDDHPPRKLPKVGAAA